MTNTELVKQLRTASVQCDEMRLRDFGYLMKCAADALEQLEKESRKWELDAHANKLERDNYLKKSQEFAAAWCDALGKVRVWIPVTERSPKDGEEVLAWCKSGFAYVDWWQDGKWKVQGIVDNKYELVTHWMPLPEPPKEVGE